MFRGTRSTSPSLPARAFDSPQQYAETAALAMDYNNNGQTLTPEIDARFAKLAEERYAAHPLRSHVLLPVGRVLDMWLRPRVENLPIDLDWWVYKHHYAETRFSWFYAGLNALYLILGFAGLCMRPRIWPWMLAYLVLRSALLLTVEAPEARYTLECFPMLFVLGGPGALPIHGLGLAVGLEGKDAGGQRLIEFEVEVDADARLALTLVKYLLQADAARGIHPDRHLQKILAHRWILGNEIKLVSLYAVDGFLSAVFDVPFVGEIFATGAEAKHEVAAELVGLVDRSPGLGASRRGGKHPLRRCRSSG